MGFPARRALTAPLAAVVVAGGLAAHAWLPSAAAGPVGDALYATLVVLLVALVRPRTRTWVAAAVVWGISAAVEALQLTGLPATVVAHVPLARYALGTTFAAVDLAWYAVGAALGGLLVAFARSDLDAIQVRHTRTANRRHRVLVPAIVAGVLAVAVAVTGTLAWTVRGEARDLRSTLGSARTALAQSKGQVADDATRTALSASIAAAESLLRETPILQRGPHDAVRAGDLVTADVDALAASRLTKARSDADAALTALTPVTARATQVLTATDGLAVPAPPRTALSTALDAAKSATAAAAGLDKATPAQAAQVEKKAADLTAAARTVHQATVALLTATDAALCPYPDQVWFPEDGKIPDADLAPIPWAPQFRLRKDVLPRFVAMNAAFKAQFGHDLVVNSAYRSVADQQAVYGDPARPNPEAAPPGCSNHGLGTAIDIKGITTPDNAQYAWLAAHSQEYGWYHPAWADPTGRLPEPWHWQADETPTGY